MQTRFDFLGYDKNEQLVLVVEAKKRFSASGEWASKLRRNILAHGAIPETPFFLVVLPDKLYLWKNAGVLPEQVEPNYVVDARPLLEPYFQKAGLDSTSVSGQTFEIVVASFLRDLLTQIDKPNQSYEFAWFVGSGLYEALKGGRIDHEAVLV